MAPRSFTDFRLTQLGKFLTFAMIAIGLDLIWGYGGMLSLGQGLFFGLGAYGFAMYLKLQSSGGKIARLYVLERSERVALVLGALYRSPIFAIARGPDYPGIACRDVGLILSFAAGCRASTFRLSPRRSRC